jgi:hypothetical protein
MYLKENVSVNAITPAFVPYERLSSNSSGFSLFCQVFSIISLFRGNSTIIICKTPCRPNYLFRRKIFIKITAGLPFTQFHPTFCCRKFHFERHLNVLPKLSIQGPLKFSSISGSNVTRKCYGNLGCLEITEDWYGMMRPVNVLPQDRKEINTQFFLRTRENPQGVSGEESAILH